MRTDMTKDERKEYGGRIIKKIQRLNKSIQESGGEPPTVEKIKELLADFGENLNPFGIQVVEMIQGFNIAIHQAGGAIRDLKDESAEDLILALAPNNVRFVFSKPPIKALVEAEIAKKVAVEIAKKVPGEFSPTKLKKTSLIPCAQKGCSCTMQVGEIVLLQEKWYVEPHSCTDGDYWRHGECQFICHSCNRVNRLLFRNGNNNKLFGYQEKELFARVIEFHDGEEDERKLKKDAVGCHVNNYHLEKILLGEV